MKFPQLKNALLCRILVYAVILGGFIAPIIIIVNLDFLHPAIKAVACIALLIAFLIYLVKNFVLLMSMDFILASLHCSDTARERFTLPRSFSVKGAERRILKFGKSYSPTAILPKPDMLLYKSSAPLTVYSSGIERVVAVYHVDCLDKSQYIAIMNSAVANSSSLAGKAKHLLLDKSQKKSPLNRVTVIIIFAKQVEPIFKDKLSERVCKDGGDGFDTAIIPCAVDLEADLATFDSVRIPFMGFQYPVKNRGIRLIRKFLFNGRLTLKSSPDRIAPKQVEIDVKQSLWSFWRDTKKKTISAARDTRRRYEKMEHGELIFEDGYLYLRWESRGIFLSVDIDEEGKTAKINEIDFDFWYYPKSNKIAKATVKELKSVISSYFAELGYTTSFFSYDQ